MLNVPMRIAGFSWPAIHQAPNREAFVRLMPRRGSSAIDVVNSLLRGGEQRAQIFTLRSVASCYAAKSCGTKKAATFWVAAKRGNKVSFGLCSTSREYFLIQCRLNGGFEPLFELFV